MPAPRYAEHPPPRDLHALVECVWTRTAPDAADAAPTHRVLPDGSVDLIVALGGGWSDTRAGSSLRAVAGAYFVGSMTAPLVVSPQPGTTFIGVRCRPGAARALLGVPAAELTDARAEIGDLWPDSAEPLHAMTRRAAGDTAPDLPELRRRFVHLLGRRFARASAPPADVRAAVADIRRTRGRIRIDALCATLGVTRQHLARRFAEHVGIAPKLLARIERVRHVRGLASTSGGNWSRIAHEAGYADQAHLVNDFGELTGLTPTAWLAGA